MSIANSIRAQIPPIHSEGYPFIGGFALASLVLFWIWTPLGWIGTLLTVWCALFFRDPVRVTPVREGIVVAPADGRVSMIAQVLPPAELGLGDRPLPRISVFMSVFNCHVNRSPVAGRIDRIAYRPGTFINAELDKASEDNGRDRELHPPFDRQPDRRQPGADREQGDDVGHQHPHRDRAKPAAAQFRRLGVCWHHGLLLYSRHGPVPPLRG